jgi:tetraprenyl-beta-curcumene synthase
MLARYWLTVFPLARRALKRWTQAAAAIPDPDLRRIAESTLADEHLNAEGAAIFATLSPWRHTPALVRALVAYQVLYDYLDTLTEAPAHGPADTRYVHRALLDALDPDAASRDWYAHRPGLDDGGYLAALVTTCREALHSLPSYAAVAPSAMRAADLSRHVQALNHDATAGRAQRLRAWARTHPATSRLRWWECAASASSSLGVHVLAALATEPNMTASRARHAEQAYCVSLGALNTLLESLVDLPRDLRTGDHSIASYYRSPDEAASRIQRIATVARMEALRLPNGNRHVIILAGMVGFYLSCAEAWQPHARAAASRTVRAVGYPAHALIAVLRLRRFAVRR